MDTDELDCVRVELERREDELRQLRGIEAQYKRVRLLNISLASDLSVATTHGKIAGAWLSKTRLELKESKRDAGGLKNLLAQVHELLASAEHQARLSPESELSAPMRLGSYLTRHRDLVLRAYADYRTEVEAKVVAEQRVRELERELDRERLHNVAVDAQTQQQVDGELYVQQRRADRLARELTDAKHELERRPPVEVHVLRRHRRRWVCDRCMRDYADPLDHPAE